MFDSSREIYHGSVCRFRRTSVRRTYMKTCRSIGHRSFSSVQHRSQRIPAVKAGSLAAVTEYSTFVVTHDATGMNTAGNRGKYGKMGVFKAECRSKTLFVSSGKRESEHSQRRFSSAARGVTPQTGYFRSSAQDRRRPLLSWTGMDKGAM